MNTVGLMALRAVLGAGFAGTLFVLFVMVPLLAIDLREVGGDITEVRIPILGIVAVGIVAIQVVLVCTWRLSTMVRRGTVFSPAAFRWVDVVIGAIAVGSLLTFALGVVVAPGHAVPPGLVLLLGGAGLLVAGVALVVWIMRMLLVQAVDRDAEARTMRAELDEVI
ncbi:MAG TPA: DUF2975 domain-containing protein [Ornithinimicrobium sp.]|uniref:DUF2975 domain-containing protein n=1 Tax=Ornithinimicrobium sp. TaxID=1977084 RepID=UPI002B479D5E|nr:DUF2975 domain-containing protein [Ornithinimicrobium sp.]HKJ11025.1 DUF2975 domain-containing protein [Ornithinimicrobium sp.]